MKRTAFLVLSAILILGAIPATAQESRFTAAVLGGAQWNAGGHLAGDNTIGFQLGYTFCKNWAFQVEGMTSNPEPARPHGVGPMVLPGGLDTTDLLEISGSAVRFFPIQASHWTPFVSAGISWVDIDYNNPIYYPNADGIGWGLNLGAGVRYELAEHSFALGQVRWLSLVQPNLDSLQVVVGFGFGIGNR
jgi:hypothetical protein